MRLSLPNGVFAAYIFDCDGTLADNMALHLRAWRRVLADVGEVLPEDVFWACAGRPNSALIAALNDRLVLTLDVERTIDAKGAYYLELLPQVRPVQQVVDVSRAALGAVPMAVASGGRRRYVEATLEALGIRAWFDAVVCAEDYARGKPAPDPFLEAARRVGVDPGDCLAFDDADDGIEAATAAGMAWVRVPARPELSA